MFTMILTKSEDFDLALKLFEQEEFANDEAVIGGYDQIAYYFEKELHNKIILNSPIQHINYEQDIIKVVSGNETYEANAVIVTASLGVLKKEVIKFIPELPIKKQQSIKKLGWGTLNFGVIQILLLLPIKKVNFMLGSMKSLFAKNRLLLQQ